MIFIVQKYLIHLEILLKFHFDNYNFFVRKKYFIKIWKKRHIFDGQLQKIFAVCGYFNEINIVY